jgi:hypothetical protein
MKRLLLILLLFPVFARAQIITTYAGNGIAGNIGDSSSATSAEICAPYGIAIDDVGNMYIANRGCGSNVRKVDKFGVNCHICR